MRKVEISPKTIVFATLFILGLYVLWLIQELLFSLLIAFILMSALKPGVRVLEKRHVPRKLAAVIVYLFFIVVFGCLFSMIFPPIIIEGTALFHNLPAIIHSLSPTVAAQFQIESLTQYIPNVTSQAFEILGNIFSNVLFVVTTLFFGFYLIIEEDVIKNFIASFLTKEKATELALVFEHAEKRMSAWFWGQLSLMFVVGLFTFIGLNIIGMKYALALGVFAGLMEIVPTIGPILSLLPALLIGFAGSYVLGVATIALYFIVQQLENNLIVPWIMRQAVGLDPITTLIALVVGGKLGGILGILLSIPILLFVGSFIAEFRRNRALFEDIF